MKVLVSLVLALGLAVAAAGMVITNPEDSEHTNLENPESTEMEALATNGDAEVAAESENIGDKMMSLVSGDREKAIIRQLKLLKKLCRPRLTPVYVREELGETSSLLDYHILPSVLAVKRCDNSCTYCGRGIGSSSENGKTCQATKQRVEMFTVRFSRGSESFYEQVPIPVHRKCKCR